MPAPRPSCQSDLPAAAQYELANWSSRPGGSGIVWGTLSAGPINCSSLAAGFLMGPGPPGFCPAAGAGRFEFADRIGHSAGSRPNLNGRQSISNGCATGAARVNFLEGETL